MGINIIDIFLTGLGVLIGVLVTGFYFIRKQKKLREGFIEKQKEEARLQSELDIRNRWYEEIKQEYEKRMQSLSAELDSSRIEASNLKQNLVSLQEKNAYLTQMKDEAQALYEKFKAEFEAI